MNRDDMAQLSPSILAEHLLFFGKIIRLLDEDCEWLEYWTQDGDYINDVAFASIKGIKHIELDADTVKGNWADGEREMKNENVCCPELLIVPCSDTEEHCHPVCGYSKAILANGTIKSQCIGDFSKCILQLGKESTKG